SEEQTSELQSLTNLVCRLLLEKKNNTSSRPTERRPLLPTPTRNPKFSCSRMNTHPNMVTAIPPATSRHTPTSQTQCDTLTPRNPPPQRARSHLSRPSPVEPHPPCAPPAGRTEAIPHTQRTLHRPRPAPLTWPPSQDFTAPYSAPAIPAHLALPAAIPAS